MSISADAINAANQIQVRPQDLLASFRQYQGKIKILSLDCFDTLL